jgi:hypothetical protein
LNILLPDHPIKSAHARIAKIDQAQSAPDDFTTRTVLARELACNRLPAKFTVRVALKIPDNLYKI